MKEYPVGGIVKKNKMEWQKKDKVRWHIIIQITEEDKKCIRKMAIDSNKSLAEWIGGVLVDKVKEANDGLIRDITVFAGRK